MIFFLIKGIIRDRSRSLFPLLTVMAGVSLTVLLYCWIKGMENDIIQANAHFTTGHLKLMSRAYAKQADQLPNDLAYSGVQALLKQLQADFPQMDWTPRIRFGGLLDIPNDSGETKSQSPIAGLGVDLLSGKKLEPQILRLSRALVRGRLPARSGEILVSEELYQRLKISLNETATLISSTMYGSMATYNFKVVGSIRFGISAMDRGAMICDLGDIQNALDMPDAAGEILGFFSDRLYHHEQAKQMAKKFNSQYLKTDDPFAPEMLTLRDQAGLAQLLDYTTYLSSVFISIFVMIMAIVLWNAGLMSSLRRYGEIGIRLAIGEDKRHLYLLMIAESLIIGLMGSILGTVLGLAIAYYLQVKGLNISSMLKNASMVISDVLRTQITPVSFIIGFIPGLVATFLGTAMAGIGIFKRQTSQLSKEFEA